MIEDNLEDFLVRPNPGLAPTPPPSSITDSIRAQCEHSYRAGGPSYTDVIIGPERLEPRIAVPTGRPRYQSGRPSLTALTPCFISHRITS